MKKQKKSPIDLTDGVEVCAGCKQLPVDVGSFGRYKLLCSRYAAHGKEAAELCHKAWNNTERLSPQIAVYIWNLTQTGW